MVKKKSNNDMISDEEIFKMLEERETMNKALKKLIEALNKDNKEHVKKINKKNR